MINELTVIEAMETTIESNINTYLSSDLSSLSSANVTIDFPDVDLMPKDVMIYLHPNYAQYEALATTNDRSLFTVSVFLLCKRDTKVNLTKKMFGYYNALYETLRRHMELSGTVDFSSVTNVEFYPAIDMNKNVQGAEISVAVEYTKDF